MDLAPSRRDIVVVGASVGGVGALRRLAGRLPAGLPAAVLVVQHIGPNRSTLPQLLAASGPLPASHARDGETPHPGRLHVAPPDCHLLLQGGRLRVVHGPKEHHTRPAIDPLFRSAAIDAGPRVVGVVLTGTLEDGTAGLQAVKDCGGLALVQHPEEAEAPEMPLSALRHVAVDRVLPLDGLADAIAELAGRPVAPPLRPPPPHWRLEQQAAGGGDDARQELNRLGTPSGLVCPDCGGGLWHVDGSRPPRYRCHTGHAYTLQTLRRSQDEATEQALWAAIRALEDQARLAQQMAALDRAAGDEARGRRSDAKAARVAAQVQALRRIVEAD